MTDKDSTQHDQNRLAQVREGIDAIDREIQALLNRRAALALQVATIKLAEANGGAVDFYRPEREAQILKAVAKRNTGPMRAESVQRIFREIISASLALESPMKVAYLGPEGTFTHTATGRHFGHAVETIPEDSITEVFKSVESGRVRFGVVPVENSTEGAVNQTLDLLIKTSLRVCGEVRLRIQHNLLSHAPSLQDIRAVYAHPQALAQCRRWLDAHLPHAERISQSSNGGAARLVTQHNDTAAIAGDTAAELYALETLVSGIEDEKNNTTRFIVLGQREIPRSGDDETMLLMSAPHRPGGLRSMLEPFEQAGVSMTRIESRPSRSKLWDYLFFVTIDGHESDPHLIPVLQQLRDVAPLMKTLGSYPRAY